MPISPNFIKNLDLFVPPSTLWGLHVSPKKEFVAVVHINFEDGVLFIDKSIVLKEVNSFLELEATINEDFINLGNFEVETITVNDLTTIANCLEDAKMCLKFGENPSCLKHILGSESDICELCVFDENIKNHVARMEEKKLEGRKKKEDRPKSFLCSICGKVFAIHSRLQVHALSHLPKSERPFKCEICAKTFYTNYGLSVHLNIHSGKKPYICKFCGKTFGNYGNRRAHVYSIHYKKNNFTCNFCGSAFLYRNKLEIHLRKHTGEQPFKCDLCEKRFKTKRILRHHMKTHFGEKGYVCELCGSSFVYPSAKYAHVCEKSKRGRKPKKK